MKQAHLSKIIRIIVPAAMILSVILYGSLVKFGYPLNDLGMILWFVALGLIALYHAVLMIRHRLFNKVFIAALIAMGAAVGFLAYAVQPYDDDRALPIVLLVCLPLFFVSSALALLSLYVGRQVPRSAEKTSQLKA